MSQLRKYFLIAVLAGYLIWFFSLLATNNLRLYINPRLAFLTVLTVLLLGTMLWNVLRDSSHSGQHRSASQQSDHCCESSTHSDEHCQCHFEAGCGHQQLDFKRIGECECCHHKKLEPSSLILLTPLILALTTPPHILSYQAEGADLTTIFSQIVTILLSVVIQALPFVLIGVFGSAAMHCLVTPEMVETKLNRAAKLPGILLAIGAGFCFPVCDCGVIPVARRLLFKKVPPYMAIAFLITAPLVNPITIWATATAFSYNLPITFTRVGIAIAVGLIVGLMSNRLFPTLEPLFNQKTLNELETAASAPAPEAQTDPHWKLKIAAIFTHANAEFLEVGKFLIIGSLIAATIQATVFKSALLGVARHPLLSTIIMMVLAVSLSLCAEADAFVARSFLNHVPLGGIMAFMAFGQMIDIKNLALLLKNFKPKALLIIFGSCALLVLGLCSLLNLFPNNALLGGRW